MRNMSKLRTPLVLVLALTLVSLFGLPAEAAHPSVNYTLSSSPQTIEGDLFRLDGDTYWIRDLGGRELRLHVDSNTTMEGPLQVGDRVVAQAANIANMPANDLYALSMRRYAGSFPPPSVAIVPAPLAPAPLAGQQIDGVVVRIDPDSYVVRDSAGRETRVYFDRNTQRDNIALGDRVYVRFDRPAGAYASSIMKRPSDVVLPPIAGAVLPRPQTVEGEVLRAEGNQYVVKDVSGKEIRLYVDKNTKLDGNLTAGDKVVARISEPPSTATPYATSVIRLGTPQAIEGQVVGIDGDSYIIRDANGREMRVFADTNTVREGNIAPGDRVVIYTGHGAAAYADSITKR